MANTIFYKESIMYRGWRV